MRSVLVLGVAFLAVILGVAAAHAERRVALIVANQTYSSLPLANPVIDAGIVEPALEQAGFEVTVVTNADLGTFDNAIADFEAKADGADVALFYFSGHGFAVADGLDVQTMLMATSADLASNRQRVLRAGGITLDEIVLGISAKAKTALFFVDACRSDPKARGETDRIIPVIHSFDRRNIFIGLSTRLGRTATDGEAGQGTAFARAFAEHIAQPGVRIDDAFTRVRREVEDATDNRQSPEIVRYDLDEPLILASLAPAPAATVPDPEPAPKNEPSPAALPAVPRESKRLVAGLPADAPMDLWCGLAMTIAFSSPPESITEEQRETGKEYVASGFDLIDRAKGLMQATGVSDSEFERERQKIDIEVRAVVTGSTGEGTYTFEQCAALILTPS